MILLKKIGKSSDEILESDVLLNVKGGHVKAKYDLGELENDDYIKRDYSQRMGDYTYVLTHKGRTYLVTNDHV